MSSKLLNMVIIANSQTKGDTLSGADRIFIECSKYWSKMGHNICLITCEEGYKMCQRYGLRGVDYIIASPRCRLPLYLLYVLRMIKGIVLAWRMSSDFRNTIIYSSSDFWPDSIPACLWKMRFKRVKWIAGFYLFVPNPFSKESPYKGKRLLRGLLYYVSQMPVYWLVKRYADMVWVTNDSDRWRFIDNYRLTLDKVIAVRGGVDIKASTLIPELKQKRFDAVFIGRFHPQKGVLELVDIWRYVCEKRKHAKLAIIGVGELEGEVKKRIRKYGLENNVVLFGFKDGVKKLKIFKDSKVVVHPAIYDSGGMAACEAMACGLPGVSFDLPALRTYYPKGMLKTPCYDLRKFAENILKLLKDEELYRKTGKDALDWAREWDWDKKSKHLLEMVLRVLDG